MNEHERFERDWWGDCLNTFGEEAKQITYAHRMGLVNERHPYTGAWPRYDLAGKSVLDIGGGPVSMLLKTDNRGNCTVVDPCGYPEWTRRRYAVAGIVVFQEPGETFRSAHRYDEVWIYNVLQHVDDPAEVIETARSAAPGGTLRIFEWIDMPPSLGHPHMLTVANLHAWIGSPEIGTTEMVNENSAVGNCFYGAFTL